MFKALSFALNLVVLIVVLHIFAPSLGMQLVEVTSNILTVINNAVVALQDGNFSINTSSESP